MVVVWICLLTTPFIKIFGKLEPEITNVSLTGKIGTTRTSVSSTKFGQVEVVIDGSPIVINTKTVGDKSLNARKKVLVIDFNKDENFFIVEPYEEI